MPLVTMPDGQIVEIPDQLSPELATRLRAMTEGAAPKDGVITKVRKGIESVVEPAITMGSGLLMAPIAGAAGLAGDIYSGITGGPRIGQEVASDLMSKVYQPRSQGGRDNLQSIAKLLERSKLAGLPVMGNEIPMLVQAARRTTRNAPMVAEAISEKIGSRAQDKSVRLMMNAIKGTPTQLMKGDVEVAANELLKRGLSPDSKGVAVIEARINQLNKEIANKIGDSEALINKQAVLDKLIGVRDRVIKNVNPESDLATVARVGDEFKRHPLATGETIPVKTAQGMKQETYSDLRKKYGQLGAAEVEAQKALARGLKEEISSVVPGLEALNAEESALFRTLNAVERRALMDLNKDPVPLTGALRSPAAWAAYTADKSSAFKALLARAMYRMGDEMRFKASTKPVTEPLSLAPVGEPLVPSTPQGPMPQGRGLLGFADEGQMPVKTEPQMPAVEFPIEPRLKPMYEGESISPAAKMKFNVHGVSDEVGIVPKESYSPNLKMPEVQFNTPKERGLLNLEEMTAEAVKNRAVPEQGIDFMGKTEFWQQPAMKQATEAFIRRAEELRSIINNKYPIDGRKQASALLELQALEKEFGAGAKLGGLRGPQDAYSAVYQAGGETQLPIQKTYDPRITAAILGRK